jgi:hypothetical protein
MPLGQPPASDLLGAVIAFLEDRVLPDLAGDRRFHCRVAINALGIVKRELELGPALDAAERERHANLLGADGDLRDLNAELARRIREGRVADRDALVDHLRRTVADTLRINNPGWLEEPS